MKFNATPIAGCFEIEFFHAKDNRGSFTKTLHAPSLQDFGLESSFEESFYSLNKKGVVRGMHFQLPPADHVKLVYCNAGSLIDVVVDLRTGSDTYGKHFSIELSGTNNKGLYIPKGLAHGFETLENNTLMTYLTSTAYNPHADSGILFSSIDYSWQTKSPIISERDLAFEKLENFNTPFHI